MSKSVQVLMLNCVFAGLIAVFGALCLRVASPDGLVTPVWIAGGIAAFAIWRHDFGVICGVACGMFLGFFSSSSMQVAAQSDVLLRASMAITPALVATAYPLVAIKCLKVLWARRQRFAHSATWVAVGLAVVVTAAFLFAGLSSAIIPQASALPASNRWYLLVAGNLSALLIFFPVCLLFTPVSARLGPRMIGLLSSYALMLTILSISVGGTIYAWTSIHATVQKYHQSRFDALTTESKDALLFRLASYEQALIGGIGFFNASSFVSRSEWRAYVEGSILRERFPGINGIGYIAKVADDDKDAFIDGARRGGMPDFTEKPEGEHPENYIIYYIEPIEINLAAVGLNIAFEAHRRQAAQSAMDTGQPTITKRILLVQDAEQTPGFLLLLPHYEPGAPLDTIAQRRAATLGWVYAPFIAKNFLHDLTLEQGVTMNLRIYDGVTTNEEDLIFASDGDNRQQSREHHLFKASTKVQLMGQPWTLVWESTAEFDDELIDKAAPLVALGGGMLTGLLALIFVLILRRDAQVRAEVDRKTKTIASAKSRLQTVLDTVADGIVSISSKGQIRAFNPAAEHIFGYHAHEVIGQSMTLLIPEHFHSDENGYLRKHLTSLEKNEDINANVTARRKDGTVFPIEMTLSEIEAGHQGGFVGSIRDVTDRLEAETALKLSEETFRQAMQQASIGMALVAIDGTWLRVNQALCDLFGVQSAALIGANMEELAHPDDVRNGAALMEDLRSGEKSNCQYEKRLIAKSGAIIWTQVSVSLVSKRDGTPDYYISQFEDITERKEVDRIKSEFVSTVSHELRTPLTSIRGSLGLIVGMMAGNLPDKLFGLIDTAHKNTERLISLVNDILDIDKLESGQMHLDIRPENIANFVERVVEANTSFAISHGVRLHMEPIDRNLVINVDAGRLEQVFANLISNAAKFSFADGEVCVFARKTDDIIRVSVRDNGIGISNEFKGRIFTKFAQADSSTTRKKGGTGLGLLISKQLVQQMMGQIGFDTQEGQGTTFWVEFPDASSASFGESDSVSEG